MKKLLLVSALLVGGMSSAVAQAFDNPTNTNFQNVNSPIEMGRLKGDITPYSVKAPFSVKAPSTRPTLSAMYTRPVGTLHAGLNADGSIMSGPNIMGGGQKNWVFRNGSTEGVNYEWYFGGEKIESQYIDAAGNLTLFFPGIGAYKDTPEIVVSDNEGSTTASYQYGTAADANGSVPATRWMLGGMPEYFNLTMADMTYGGLGISYNDADFPYIMGTGTPAPDDLEATGAKATAVVGFFEKPMVPLYVQNVGAIIVSDNETPIPAGGTLKMEIRALDEYGELTSEVIASSVMPAADLKYIQDIGTYGTYYAPFYFTKEEGGLTLQYNLVIDQPCAVVISGFDQPGYDLGFLVAGNYGLMAGRGSYIVDGKVRQWTYSDVDINRFDLFIQFNAVFNTLSVLSYSQFVTVPAEGGEAYFTHGEGEEERQYSFIQVYSTFPTVQDDEECVWLDEVPSWLTVEPLEDEFEESHVIKFVVTGEPLPEDIKGRRAELVFRSFGVEALAIVLQESEKGAAIEENTLSVVKAVQNGENFDLTYPETVNAVTVLNAAGQTIASYELPANGQFTLPAANLNKGLYILKFNGERNASVKIMK